nr:PTS fructose transporter subunit IIBC [Candidatus Pantoea persica]
MAAGMVPPLAMGLCFTSEGAIPFAVRDPMRVLPCCIVGGAKLMAPHGGLFVLLIPGAITPVLGYLLAIIVGTAIAGLGYAILKRPEEELVKPDPCPKKKREPAGSFFSFSARPSARRSHLSRYRD